MQKYLIMLVTCRILILCIFVVQTNSTAWYEGLCGRSKYISAGEYILPSPRIIGGHFARPHEFPWQVSLVQVRNRTKHICGATIITENWILTAAHCLLEAKRESLRAIVGDHMRSHPDNIIRQGLNISRIIAHSNYSVYDYYNDIALLKVSKAIQFNINVQPICPPDLNTNFTHKKVIASGWGALEIDGEAIDLLKYTTLNVTGVDYCKKMYHERIVSEDMICTTDNEANKQRDACHRDSGGPLAIKDETGIFHLIGILSWGRECASQFPGVSTRVKHFLDWIEYNIEEDSLKNKILVK